MLGGFFKRSVNGSVAAEDPYALGNLAVELGYISPSTLEEALKIQKERLGDILVEMKALSREQLVELLFEQKIRRGGVPHGEVIAFESRKRRSRVRELGSVFESAADHTSRFVAELNGSVKAVAE